VAQITIVGLGPGTLEHLTLEAWQIMSEIKELWLRTLRHPIMSHLPGTLILHSFDDLYESSDTFEDVYALVAARVLELGQREEGVYYAVPGHPLVGESTVTRILRAGRENQIPVRIVSGLSFVEPSLTALEFDALDGLQIVDALDVVTLYHPPLNPDMPALIAQVYSRAVASELKLVLMSQYSDEHRVALVDAAGTAVETVKWLPLYEIDRHEATPLTSLYVSSLSQVSGFESFQQTVAHLRAPDGCPWDREQTHASLRNSLLEETYEVLAAIDAGEVTSLREELGDLLLQVVLHTQIAVEDGEFYMSDVIAGIDAKLKHRHPHVWGDVQVQNSGDVVTNWEVIKRNERESKGAMDRSMLDGIPLALPGLAQAAAYGSRITRVGLELASSKPTLQLSSCPSLFADGDKIRRALDAVVQEMVQHIVSEEIESTTEAAGALLFTIANWMERLGVDPESALREANRRFARCFRRIEAEAQRLGVSPGSLDEQLIDTLWKGEV